MSQHAHELPPQDGWHQPRLDAPRRAIKVLPPEVAARIAAGEVIERPASVVKELIENALDAGARQVWVEVSGGGLALIRVRDDGCGIPPGDLALACQRHATSKLGEGELSAVRTLGFRGEALPSIAMVAELSLLSTADDSGLGRRVTLRDGRLVADEPAPTPRGTTVTVRHLFANVPARLAATARPQTEIAQIAQTVRRLALAAPDVRFGLSVDGRQGVRTTGSGDAETALIEIYGGGLAGSLLRLGPLEVAGATISGFIAGPEATRPGRGQVNVIVNGRWVQPRGLLAALERAYRPALPRGRHPVLALRIETPPERVDINIHPSKLEVRLLAEQAIGAAAGELIRATLTRRAIPLSQAPRVGLDALPTLSEINEVPVAWDDDAPIVTPHLPPLRLIAQVQDRLILLEGDDGLYLVDQHRAHERILYQRLAAAHAGSGWEPVTLREPLLLELRPGQVAPFGRRLADLAALGFHCEVFGGRLFLLRAAPSLPGVLPGGDGEPLANLGERDGLLETLLTLADDEPGEGESWRERLLVRLSCRSAVRRGRPLPRPALRALVTHLGHTDAPAVCPHGSPLLMQVSSTLLERQFDWR